MKRLLEPHQELVEASEHLDFQPSLIQMNAARESVVDYHIEMVQPKVQEQDDNQKAIEDVSMREFCVQIHLKTRMRHITAPRMSPLDNFLEARLARLGGRIYSRQRLQGLGWRGNPISERLGWN